MFSRPKTAKNNLKISRDASSCAMNDVSLFPPSLPPSLPSSLPYLPAICLPVLRRLSLACSCGPPQRSPLFSTSLSFALLFPSSSTPPPISPAFFPSRLITFHSCFPSHPLPLFDPSHPFSTPPIIPPFLFPL